MRSDQLEEGAQRAVLLVERGAVRVLRNVREVELGNLEVRDDLHDDRAVTGNVGLKLVVVRDVAERNVDLGLNVGFS